LISLQLCRTISLYLSLQILFGKFMFVKIMPYLYVSKHFNHLLNYNQRNTQEVLIVPSLASESNYINESNCITES